MGRLASALGAGVDAQRGIKTGASLIGERLRLRVVGKSGSKGWVAGDQLRLEFVELSVVVEGPPTVAR